VTGACPGRRRGLAALPARRAARRRHPLAHCSRRRPERRATPPLHAARAASARRSTPRSYRSPSDDRPSRSRQAPAPEARSDTSQRASPTPKTTHRGRPSAPSVHMPSRSHESGESTGSPVIASRPSRTIENPTSRDVSFVTSNRVIPPGATGEHALPVTVSRRGARRPTLRAGARCGASTRAAHARRDTPARSQGPA